MPYMVTPDGEIICDTANEALSLQRAILNHIQKQEKPYDHRSPKSRGIQSSVNNQDFIGPILESANQRNLVKFLYEQPNGCTDVQLRDRLKLENNMALSGVTTAIIRKAKRHGLEGDDVILRTSDKEKNETQFMLSESFRKIIDSVGGIK